MVKKYTHLDYESYKPVLLDSTGRKLTVGLFQELAEDKSKAIFKLSDWRKVYVDIADPTDYEAALVLIGSWEHWLALVANKQFAAELEKWRAEVDVKLKSEALTELKKQSRSDKGTAAAKWLAENGYNPKKVGRPRKDKDEESDVPRNVAADAGRLGIKLVK